MPFIEELPKKKIQDFFAEGDPERTSQKPHTKQAEKRPVSLYPSKTARKS